MVDIISYYDGRAFGWVVLCVDTDGNQIWDAQYFPNRAALNEGFVK